MASMEEVYEAVGELKGDVKHILRKLDTLPCKEHDVRLSAAESCAMGHKKEHETERRQTDRALRTWQFIIGAFGFLLACGGFVAGLLLRR